MSVFFCRQNVKIPEVQLFISKISKTIENSSSAQVRQQYLGCIYTKFQLKIPIVFDMC